MAVAGKEERDWVQTNLSKEEQLVEGKKWLWILAFLSAGLMPFPI